MWLCIISGKQLEDTYWLRAALLSSRADLSGISKWGHCGRERANILPDFWLACKCNLCEFASSQASNLRTHVKRHTREKLPLAERKRERELLARFPKPVDAWGLAWGGGHWPKLVCQWILPQLEFKSSHSSIKLFSTEDSHLISTQLPRVCFDLNCQSRSYLKRHFLSTVSITGNLPAPPLT